MGRDINYLYSFILAGVLSGLLPNKIFRHFQLSSRARFYEVLGVKFIQRFVQNGTYINRIIRRNDESYKVIRDRRQVQRYLSTINMYERYHVSCFVFFGLTLIYAIISRADVVVLPILAANVLYNVYPILLQQYIKLRVIRILK
jgi:Glycosyl-4,4'-diaponeurosporenoate acyltransferase